MSVEAVPIVASFLADPTYGVNALLPRIPHDPWDDVPPPVVQIADETRDGWVARHIVPDAVMQAGPALAVSQSDEATWILPAQRASLAAAVQDGESSVVILYLVRKSQKDVGMRFAKDVLRAARWSLTLLMDPANVHSRERNAVQLVTCTALKQVPAEGERGDALVSGALIATYATRETAPFLTD